MELKVIAGSSGPFQTSGRSRSFPIRPHVEQRVVVTKDADFVDTHLLRKRPDKLLLISTGNISNRELEALVTPLIPDIIREFASHSFLELGRTGIVIRG